MRADAIRAVALDYRGYAVTSGYGSRPRPARDLAGLGRH